MWRRPGVPWERANRPYDQPAESVIVLRSEVAPPPAAIQYRKADIVNGTPGTRTRVRGLALVIAMAMVVLTFGAATAGAAPQAKKKGTPVLIVVGDTAGTKAPMTMTVAPTSVPAGKVTFTVKNEGTVIHEMVVLKTKTPYTLLPVVRNKVSESTAVGEVADIGKGKTKSGTMTLKAGSYVLVCNLSKHYGLGMRAAFTVT